MQIRILNICFINFNDHINALGVEKQIIWHTAKVKDLSGLKQIEEGDRQFLVGKLIHGVEFWNPSENSIKKKNRNY